jgi:hypothetical protein
VSVTRAEFAERRWQLERAVRAAATRAGNLRETEAWRSAGARL